MRQREEHLKWQPITTKVRSDVKEFQDRSLEALQAANAPDARSVVTELDEADVFDEGRAPGGKIVPIELIVRVISERDGEFTCHSCFLVQHQSQKARASNGRTYCIECEG